MSSPARRSAAVRIALTRVVLAVAVQVSVLHFAAVAMAAPALVDAAMAHLNEGRNADAQAAFEALLAEHGDHAGLYYNLGLACARQGDRPRALLAFERSLALDPRADDALEHLEHTRELLQRELLSASTERSLTQGEPARLVWWRFFHGLGTLWPPLVLLLAWSLAFTALLVRRVARHVAARDTLAVVAAVALAASGLAAAALLGQRQTEDVRPAVVLADAPRLAESPTELAGVADADDLYPGATVLVLGEQGEWVQVELADGSRGWLSRGAVGEVRPQVGAVLP